MKSSLRPTSIDDLSSVRQFLQRSFNAHPNAPFLDHAMMAWKYWDRRGDWDGPRAYVLERDGAIVAHAGIYPVTFGAGGVRGIQMIDWASTSESPGAGLALLQKLSAMFDFVYSIGGSAMTCKILPTFGFAECARQWRGIRPFRPFRQALRYEERDWKLTPRLARNLLWSLQSARHGRDRAGWSVEEIAPHAVSEEFYTQSGAEAHFSPRPPAFFEYLLRCPMMDMHLYSIRDPQGPRGHFAAGVLRGEARLAGLWLREPNPDAWHTAFSLAQETARELPGACALVAAGTEGASEQAAVRSGFHVMGHTAVYLLNKQQKLALSPDFQFQLSDDDAWFLDRGDFA